MPASQDLEQRLREVAVVYHEGIEPPAGLHAQVMASVEPAQPRTRRRTPVMLRELAMASALVVFVALVAAGFSKFHHASPAPAKATPSPSPRSAVIPWSANIGVPAKTEAPRVMTPDQAAQDIRQTVTAVHPVVLPRSIPAGLHAEVIDEAQGFSVQYLAADGRKITFGIVVANPGLPGPNTQQGRLTFHGASADWSFQDPTVPGTNRWLMWNEPGTPVSGQPGVPYFLSAEGFTAAQFWQIANSIGPIPAPVAARPCAVGDLSAIFGGTNGAAGTVINTVLLSNRSATACSLTGFARIELVTSQGAALGLPQQDQPTYLTSSGLATVILAPGQSAPVPPAGTRGMAMLQFDWYDCSFRGQVAAVRVTLPGTSQAMPVAGNTFGMPSPEVNVCDAQPNSSLKQLNSGPIQAIQPFEAAPTTSAGLTAHLQMPASVIAGTTMRYQVTLTNVSGAPITFTDCPAYEEGLGPNGLAAYQLNCTPAGTIKPGASVTFAMEYEVPAGTSAGPQKFIWRLYDSFGGSFAGTVVPVSSR